MISFSESLALIAAVFLALSSILAVNPSQHLGAIGFVRWRGTIVAFMLWCLIVFVLNEPFKVLTTHSAWVMMISGIIGIFVGDTALFASMNRLGPRRSGIVFATHALFSAFMGFVILGERMGWMGYLGAIVSVLGVMTAVAFRRNNSMIKHQWEAQPLTLIGISFGLLAAFCQAAGSLIAKPLLTGEDAMHPLLALAIRITISIIVLWLWRMTGHQASRSRLPINVRVFLQTTISGVVGLGFAMGFVLWALNKGEVGMVGVLSSLSPIFVLPLLWLKTKQIPSFGAWVGAIIAMIGVALVTFRNG